METKTVRFEFNPKDIQDVLGQFTKAWNENPNTQVTETSSGLVSQADDKHYVELVLAAQVA